VERGKGKAARHHGVKTCPASPKLFPRVYRTKRGPTLRSGSVPRPRRRYTRWRMHVKRASMGSGFMEFSVREIDTRALRSAGSTQRRVPCGPEFFNGDTGTTRSRTRRSGKRVRLHVPRICASSSTGHLRGIGGAAGDRLIQRLTPASVER